MDWILPGLAPTGSMSKSARVIVHFRDGKLPRTHLLVYWDLRAGPIRIAGDVSAGGRRLKAPRRLESYPAGDALMKRD